MKVLVYEGFVMNVFLYEMFVYESVVYDMFDYGSMFVKCLWVTVFAYDVVRKHTSIHVFTKFPRCSWNVYGMFMKCLFTGMFVLESICL